MRKVFCIILMVMVLALPIWQCEEVPEGSRAEIWAATKWPEIRDEFQKNCDYNEWVFVKNPFKLDFYVYVVKNNLNNITEVAANSVFKNTFYINTFGDTLYCVVWGESVSGGNKIPTILRSELYEKDNYPDGLCALGFNYLTLEMEELFFEYKYGGGLVGDPVFCYDLAQELEQYLDQELQQYYGFFRAIIEVVKRKGGGLGKKTILGHS